MECSDRTRIIMRCLDYARHDRRGILSRDDRGRFLDCARNDRRGTLSRDDIQAPSCQVPVPLTGVCHVPVPWQNVPWQNSKVFFQLSGFTSNLSLDTFLSIIYRTHHPLPPISCSAHELPHYAKLPSVPVYHIGPL